MLLKIPYRRTIRFLLFFMLFSCGHFFASAQTKTITIVSDSSQTLEQLTVFDSTLVEELRTLLELRYELRFKLLGSNYQSTQIRDNFATAYADPETDLVIGSGIISSGILAQRENFPKPTIASVVIAEQLRQPPADTNAVSGIKNFTYVISPFDLKKNFQTLYRYRPYQKIAVLVGKEIEDSYSDFAQSLKNYPDSANVTVELVNYQNTAASTLNALPAETDAVFLLPMTDELSSTAIETFLLDLQTSKIPSIALFGEDYVAKGAFMGYEAEQNLQTIPRRIAINVSKIFDGRGLAELPVRIPTYNSNLLINMEAARRSEIYPDFELMADAILVNLERPITERTLSLEGAIIEGLQRNLALKIAQKDPLIAQTEIGLAKSEYLPQVEASTALTIIDDARASSSFGAQGRANWLVSGSLSQLVLAEPALANIAIQKLLLESNQQATLETRLNVVLDVAEAFLNVLQTKSFLQIQNQNIARLRENRDIAEAKGAVGYTGQSDLNRLKSEVANANIDLNNARANLASAKFRLNQLLNRPVDEAFLAEDAELQGSILQQLTTDIVPLIRDQGIVERFADFMVTEANRNLPELRQIEYGIAVQQRRLLSQERAFYLPSVALQGGIDYTLKRFGVSEPPPEVAMFGLGANNDVPQWNIGLSIQYPIFQGGRRKLNVEQTQLNITQLNDQQSDVRNQLELRVRTSLQTLAASGSAVRLSQISAAAAAENFEIVQDNYAQGLANVTNLLDAQNAAVQSELATANNGYQFILDYLSLERSVGQYNFLAEPTERDAFLNRLTDYLLR